MKDMEIEKKYLLDRTKAERFIRYDLPKHQVKNINQCYISYSPNSIVRIRKADDAYLLTEKSGQGSIRKEIERKISKKRYKKLKAKKIGYEIKKRRYIFEMEGYTFELDIFRGRFKNLSFLEVEFEDQYQLKRFGLPLSLKDMVVADVSEDNEYSNGYLALKKYENGCIGKYLRKVLKRYIKKVKVYSDMFSKTDDIEILHRFRINLRRVKSLLNTHKEMFCPDTYKKLNTTVKEIFLRTNLKRDIDVFLKDLDRYDVSKKDIIIENLTKISTQERAALETFFKSDEFSDKLFDLEFFIENCKFYANALYMLPARKYARKKLKKGFKKIVKNFEKLKESSDIEDFHSLRIDIKKIRYLTDAYGIFYKKKTLKRYAKFLKSYQEKFGELNDIHTHAVLIRRFVSAEDMDDFDEILKNLKDAEELAKRAVLDMASTSTEITF